MTETSSAPEMALTAPSDLPTPMSDAKVSATRPPPPPKANNLKGLLKALPANADAFMSHLQRCLATPSGIDTLLLFVCYLSRFTGAALTNLSEALARRTARELIALAFTLPPRAAIIFEAAGPAGGKGAAPARSAAAQLAALLGQRLKSLGSLASETRTITRLWALVGMYFWARRLVGETFGGRAAAAEQGEKDGGEPPRRGKLVALVDWAQLLSCGAFQVLENGAYLSGRGVLGWTPAQQGRAYVVGSRWLGVYTALELGKLLAQLVAKRDRSYAEASAEEKEEIDTLRRSLAIDMAWAPLTLHWAMETGFLSDLAVGAGGCIPGVLRMRKLWRDTA